MAILNDVIDTTSITFTTERKSLQAVQDDIAARGRAFLVVEVAGVAHAEDDHLQVVVLEDPAHLVAEEVGRPEEEVALHMDDGDLRHGALALGRHLGELSLLGELVLDQLRPGRLAKEEQNGEAHPGIDGGVQPEEQADRHREQEDGGVGSRGVGHQPDDVPVEEREPDHQDEDAQRGLRDEADQRAEEEGTEEKQATREDGGHGGARPTVHVQLAAEEGAGGGHPAEGSTGEVGGAEAEHLLVAVQAVARAGGKGLADGTALHDAEQGEGEGRADQLAGGREVERGKGELPVLEADRVEVAETLQAEGAEPGGEGAREHQGDRHCGQAGGEVAEKQVEAEGEPAHEDGPPLCTGEVLHGKDQRGEEGVRHAPLGKGEAEDIVDLVEDDQAGGRGDVAGDDRPGDELDEGGGPDKRSQQEENTGESQKERQVGKPFVAGDGGARKGTEQEDGGGVGGPDRNVGAAGEQRGDEGGHGRPEDPVGDR